MLFDLQSKFNSKQQFLPHHHGPPCMPGCQRIWKNCCEHQLSLATQSMFARAVVEEQLRIAYKETEYFGFIGL